MAGSTKKKVHVVRFDREALFGFVQPDTFLSPSGIEVLTTNGTVVTLPHVDVKTVAFIREFEASGSERERKTFAGRPRTGGLWLRLTFRDQDTLEAVMPNDLLQIDFYGFHVVPPDTTRRLFVPRVALKELQVLGVVGSPLRAAARRKPSPDQITLFEPGQ